VCPRTGGASPAVLRVGGRAAPVIALADCPANYLLTPVGVVTAAGIAAGKTLEAVTALFLLRIFVKQENCFDRAVDFLKFVLIAAIISPAVAATIGNLCIDLNGSASWQKIGRASCRERG